MQQNWQKSKICSCAFFVSAIVGIVLISDAVFAANIKNAAGIKNIAGVKNVKDSDQPIVCNGDKIEYMDENKKLVGTGHINITYGDVMLTSDRVEINMVTKEAYATGNVLLTQGKNSFKAESVLYNFQDKKGKIMNATMSAPPWYGRCDEIDKTGDKEYLLGSGYISTCDKIPPHYKIRTKQVKLYLDDRVEARNVVICAGSVPIMYLPAYSQDIKNPKPVISLIPGHSKEWGYFVLGAYRYSWDKDDQGKMHLDYRSARGVGTGVTHNYALNFLDDKINLGNGIFDYYYVDEYKSKDRPEGANRSRTMVRHEWQMDEKTQGVFEYNKLSDAIFTKDYFFRQEYVNETKPMTYAYISRQEDQYSTGFLYEPRVNHFFDQTEYLPQFDVDIKNQRLFENLPFFYRGDYSAASLSNRTANSDFHQDAGRLDGFNEISGAFMPIRSVSMKPFIGTRETYYTRGQADAGSLTRDVLYTGIDTSTKFYKTYNLESNLMGTEIHGLRHIVTPVVRYSYIPKPSVSQDKLTHFDSIDTITNTNAFTFALENNFQTKNKVVKKNKNDLSDQYDVVDLARFILSTDYDFATSPGGHFSNIIGNLELTPSNKFLIQSDVSYNPHIDSFDIANIDFVTKNDNGSKFGIGERYERSVSNQLTTDVYYPLTRKLGLHCYDRYEFQGSFFQEQEYGITYDLHCWTMDMNFNTGVNGNAVWIIFRLKAFPELPIQLGTTYESPKPQTVGN